MFKWTVIGKISEAQGTWTGEKYYRDTPHPRMKRAEAPRRPSASTLHDGTEGWSEQSYVHLEV